jgi:hypothetical protein
VSARKRPEGRKTWSHARRVAYRLLCWSYNLTIGAFVTKHDDGTLTASHTALLSAAMAIVMIRRLLPAQNTYVFASIGWPEAFVLFCVLFVKPINDALKALASSNPGKLVELLLARMGVGDVASQAPGLTGPANDGAPGGDLEG